MSPTDILPNFTEQLRANPDAFILYDSNWLHIPGPAFYTLAACGYIALLMVFVIAHSLTHFRLKEVPAEPR
jgi:hypothetical protein